MGSGAGTELAGETNEEVKTRALTSMIVSGGGWKQYPTHTVAGMFELYEQLLPTRLYAFQKTHTDIPGEVTCRLCNKAPKSTV